MNAKRFYVQLGVLALLVVLAIMPMHQHPLIHDYQSFSWMSWSFFVLFSVGLFIACSKAAQSTNKNLFGQIFLLSIVFKMMICGLLVIAYVLFVKPTSIHFILPFLLIYTAFTVYEVYFVTKLAKP